MDKLDMKLYIKKILTKLNMVGMMKKKQLQMEIMENILKKK